MTELSFEYPFFKFAYRGCAVTLELSRYWFSTTTDKHGIEKTRYGIIIESIEGSDILQKENIIPIDPLNMYLEGVTSKVKIAGFQFQYPFMYTEWEGTEQDLLDDAIRFAKRRIDQAYKRLAHKRAVTFDTKEQFERMQKEFQSH